MAWNGGGWWEWLNIAGKQENEYKLVLKTCEIHCLESLNNISKIAPT